MNKEPNTSGKKDEGHGANAKATKPHHKRWRSLVRYVLRKAQQRRSERQEKKAKESPEERAARSTANATWVIAIFTIILALVGSWTLIEVIAGGSDTHDLAIAALAANRAWLAPVSMQLAGPLENGLPVAYYVRISNTGKEPALGVIWNVLPRKAPYIPPSNGNEGEAEMGRNETCEGLEPKQATGAVIYPQATGMTSLIPLTIPDTADNKKIIDAALNRTGSLVVDGCLVYITGSAKHTSAFRFFLRDEPGKPSFIAGEPSKPSSHYEWRFNATLMGNDAN